MIFGYRNYYGGKMEYYNLTTPQKNIWNLQKYYGDTAIGNQCGAIFYKEKRDNNLIKKEIYHIINSQSGLRSQVQICV